MLIEHAVMLDQYSIWWVSPLIVDDAITDGEKIAETLARLGVVSTGPPKRRQSTGELDNVYDV